MGMRLEIDIKELAGELGDLLRPDLEELRANSMQKIGGCATDASGSESDERHLREGAP